MDGWTHTHTRMGGDAHTKMGVHAHTNTHMDVLVPIYINTHMDRWPHTHIHMDG